MEATVHDARMTILIIDDEPGNLGALHRLLHADYDVLLADSGTHGLQLVAGEARPDLILLDLMMPGLNGYAVFEQLRADPETRTIPVIFVTGMDTEDDEAEGLRMGAADYIAKPYRPQIVRARIAHQIALKQARDEVAAKQKLLEARIFHHQQALNLAQDSRKASAADLPDSLDILIPSLIDEAILSARQLHATPLSESQREELHRLEMTMEALRAAVLASN